MGKDEINWNCHLPLLADGPDNFFYEVSVAISGFQLHGHKGFNTLSKTISTQQIKLTKKAYEWFDINF